MEKKLNDVFSNLSDEEIIEISDINLDCSIDELTKKRIKTTSLKRVGLKYEEKTENIINRSKTLKKAAAIAACFIIALTISNITGFSKYLSPKSWTSRVLIGDGSKEIILNKEIGLIHINENAPKENLNNISLEQAEYKIGVDLLESPMYSNDSVNYMPVISEKEIESVNLWYPSCVVYENDKYISGDIMLLTDKATEHVIPNEDIDATGEKVLLHSYKSSNLNTTVILYTVKWSKSRLTAVFDYKNIHYSFIGNNVSKTEMMEFIESLK